MRDAVAVQRADFAPGGGELARAQQLAHAFVTHADDLVAAVSIQNHADSGLLQMPVLRPGRADVWPRRRPIQMPDDALQTVERADVVAVHPQGREVAARQSLIDVSALVALRKPLEDRAESGERLARRVEFALREGRDRRRIQTARQKRRQFAVAIHALVQRCAKTRAHAPRVFLVVCARVAVKFQLAFAIEFPVKLRAQFAGCGRDVHPVRRGQALRVSVKSAGFVAGSAGQIVGDVRRVHARIRPGHAPERLDFGGEREKLARHMDVIKRFGAQRIARAKQGVALRIPDRVSEVAAQTPCALLAPARVGRQHHAAIAPLARRTVCVQRAQNFGAVVEAPVGGDPQFAVAFAPNLVVVGPLQLAPRPRRRRQNRATQTDRAANANAGTPRAVGRDAVRQAMEHRLDRRGVNGRAVEAQQTNK